MSEYIYAGSTSQTIDWMIYDSSSTVGAGLSGLVFNSSGLKAYYRIGATGAPTAIVLVTQTAIGAWSAGGFAEIDSTNLKGVYRLDLPNAVSASNAMVTIYLYGAANMMPSVLRIDCRAVPVDVKQIGGISATGVLVSAGVGSTAFLANAPTGGGGTGANPVTITIQTTASVAIQSATVTAWKNGLIEGTLSTNVSGVAVLSLDNGTYSIVVTAAGYQGSTASLVVSGTTSQTYQLTAITITPSPSGGVTGYLYTTDTTGTVIQGGVVVSIQMTRTASGQTGEAISPVVKTVTSDSGGLAQFVGLTPGATYRFSTTRGSSWATFVAGSSTFEITSAVV